MSQHNTCHNCPTARASRAKRKSDESRRSQTDELVRARPEKRLCLREIVRSRTMCDAWIGSRYAPAVLREGRLCEAADLLRPRPDVGGVSGAHACVQRADIARSQGVEWRGGHVLTARRGMQLRRPPNRSAASFSADGESDETDIRVSGNDPLILKAKNARLGDVEVETKRLRVNGGNEIDEPNAEAQGGRRPPVVPSYAVRNHDQHHARGRERDASGLEHGNLHPDDAVNRRAWILRPRPQPGQVDALKERTLGDCVRGLTA